jgi:hypothetical protein
MVKDGGTASYHRETVLTWFNLNDDKSRYVSTEEYPLEIRRLV